MTIHELQFKIKSAAKHLNTKEVYTAFIIILVGFASFGLGRISKLEEVKTPIRIEQGTSAISSILHLPFSSLKADPSSGGQEGTEEVVNVLPSISGQFVASKGGTKYHFPWCSGAQRISEANKIWFNSVEEARKAGYTPAANCKGLR